MKKVIFLLCVMGNSIQADIWQKCYDCLKKAKDATVKLYSAGYVAGKNHATAEILSKNISETIAGVQTSSLKNNISGGIQDLVDSKHGYQQI